MIMTSIEELDKYCGKVAVFFLLLFSLLIPVVVNAQVDTFEFKQRSNRNASERFLMNCVAQCVKTQISVVLLVVWLKICGAKCIS